MSDKETCFRDGYWASDEVCAIWTECGSMILSDEGVKESAEDDGWECDYCGKEITISETASKETKT